MRAANSPLPTAFNRKLNLIWRCVYDGTMASPIRAQPDRTAPTNVASMIPALLRRRRGPTDNERS